MRYSEAQCVILDLYLRLTESEFLAIEPKNQHFYKAPQLMLMEIILYDVQVLNFQDMIYKNNIKILLWSNTCGTFQYIDSYIYLERERGKERERENVYHHWHIYLYIVVHHHWNTASRTNVKVYAVIKNLPAAYSALLCA